MNPETRKVLISEIVAIAMEAVSNSRKTDGDDAFSIRAAFDERPVLADLLECNHRELSRMATDEVDRH